MNCRIKDFREQKHLSQQQLSEISGVSRATISGLERGQIKVTTTETLCKLASALNKKVSDIFLD